MIGKQFDRCIEDIMVDIGDDDDLRAVLANSLPPANKGFSVSEDKLLETCGEVVTANSDAILRAIETLNSARPSPQG